MITAIAIFIAAAGSLILGSLIGAAHERENVLQFLAIVRVTHMNAIPTIAGHTRDAEIARITALALRCTCESIDETAKRIESGAHVGAAVAARKAGRNGRT